MGHTDAVVHPSMASRLGQDWAPQDPSSGRGRLSGAAYAQHTEVNSWSIGGVQGLENLPQRVIANHWNPGPLANALER